jgi:hypothetical protein
MPGTYNFVIEQGTTLRKRDAVGNPVNLANYDAKLQLKDKNQGTQYYELDTTNEGISFPAAGQIALYISADITTILTQSKYIYTLDLFSPNGDIIRLLKGRIDVSAAVTA